MSHLRRDAPLRAGQGNDRETAGELEAGGGKCGRRNLVDHRRPHGGLRPAPVRPHYAPPHVQTRTPAGVAASDAGGRDGPPSGNQNRLTSSLIRCARWYFARRTPDGHANGSRAAFPPGVLFGGDVDAGAEREPRSVNLRPAWRRPCWRAGTPPNCRCRRGQWDLHFVQSRRSVRSSASRGKSRGSTPG